MPEKTLQEIHEVLKELKKVNEQTNDLLKRGNDMLESLAKYMGGEKAIPHDLHKMLSDHPRAD